MPHFRTAMNFGNICRTQLFGVILPISDMKCRHQNEPEIIPTLELGLPLKGKNQCKTDLGYVYYDNELDCSFGSKKAHRPLDAFFCWL